MGTQTYAGKLSPAVGGGLGGLPSRKESAIENDSNTSVKTFKSHNGATNFHNVRFGSAYVYGTASGAISVAVFANIDTGQHFNVIIRNINTAYVVTQLQKNISPNGKYMLLTYTANSASDNYIGFLLFDFENGTYRIGTYYLSSGIANYCNGCCVDNDGVMFMTSYYSGENYTHLLKISNFDNVISGISQPALALGEISNPILLGDLIVFTDIGSKRIGFINKTTFASADFIALTPMGAGYNLQAFQQHRMLIDGKAVFIGYCVHSATYYAPVFVVYDPIANTVYTKTVLLYSTTTSVYVTNNDRYIILKTGAISPYSTTYIIVDKNMDVVSCFVTDLTIVPFLIDNDDNVVFLQQTTKIKISSSFALDFFTAFGGIYENMNYPTASSFGTPSTSKSTTTFLPTVGSNKAAVFLDYFGVSL